METKPFSSKGVGREARSKFGGGCLVTMEAKEGLWGGLEGGDSPLPPPEGATVPGRGMEDIRVPSVIISI